MDARFKYNTIGYYYTVLPSSADGTVAAVNPSISTGDVQVSIDGGAFQNINTLPTVTPTGDDLVKITVSATELSCKTIVVRFKSQTSAWGEQRLIFTTYGNSSAFEVFDFSVNSSAQTGDSYAIVNSSAYGNSVLSGRIPASLTVNGNMKSSLMEILATALTETSGYIAGAFKQFFNVSSPTGTVNSLPNATAGAASGLALVGSVMGKSPATLSSTDVSGNLPSTLKAIAGGDSAEADKLKDFVDNGYSSITHKVAEVTLVDTLTTYTGNTVQTGDSYAIVNSSAYGNSALSGRIPTSLTVNGNMKSSLMEILATALTETSGYLAGAFKKFFNVGTPTGTVNSIPDAVAGATNGIAIVGSVMGKSPATLSASDVTGNLPATIKAIAGGDSAEADKLKDFVDNGYNSVTHKVTEVVTVDTLTTYTGDTPQTGDSYAIVNSSAYGNSMLMRTSAYTVPPTVGAIDSQLSGVHGSGAWGGAGSLTRQDVRDAMTLASSATPAVGSIDTKIGLTLQSSAYTAQTGDSYSIVNNGTYGNSALKSAIGSPLQTSAYTVPPTVGAIDTQLSSIHGSGAWGGAGSLTRQDVRDAMTLASSATPAVGSIDTKIGSPLQTSAYTVPPTVGAIDTQLSGNHGSGAWGGAGSLTRQDVRDAMTMSTSATPVSGSIDTKISSIPSAAQIRAEIDTNSYRLDTTVSSRLASSAYTVPPTASSIASAVGALIIEGTSEQIPLSTAIKEIHVYAAGSVTRDPNTGSLSYLDSDGHVVFTMTPSSTARTRS